MAKREEKFHCSGYYFKDVCPSLGEPDSADIRRDSNGWLRKPRNLCKTRGLSPFHSYDLCSFCVEHRKYFREEPKHITGEDVEINSGKLIGIKA